MKFKRRFYDDSINLRNLSRKKLLVYTIVAVSFAFIIYSFLYVMREYFRVMSFDYGLYPNILSEESRNFYNLFLAALSLIFSNSLVISFIFGSTQKTMSKKSLKRRRILIDQVFLNLNFCYWFGKLCLLLGVFSFCCIDFKLPILFKYFTIVLIIVLYLESWKSLSRVLRPKRLKYLSIHALLFCLISFGLSKIDIVNYKAIDKMALESNPIVDLPNSFFNQERNRRYYPSVTFKIFRNENNKITIRNEFNEEIEIQDIFNEINRVRNSIAREELIDYLEIRISAEKDVELNYIKQIEAAFYSYGQYSITYNVFNEDELTRRFKQTGFSKRITPDVLQFRPKEKSYYPPMVEPIPYNPSFKDTLNVFVEKIIIIDSLIVPNEQLIEKFKNQFNQDNAVNFIVSSETTYEDYITVLSAYFKAVHELREKEQTEFYEYRDYNAFYEEQKKLRDKYPIRTIESYNKK
ncbi:hypothetical protein WNY78_09440 [Psychroserpens sp. AS72]|uniref:hypothetical protein n=1 Tax=Psychroserpens sp. AS72 TaxID=3135775 RepID=UPI00316FB66C